MKKLSGYVADRVSHARFVKLPGVDATLGIMQMTNGFVITMAGAAGESEQSIYSRMFTKAIELETYALYEVAHRSDTSFEQVVNDLDSMMLQQGESDDEANLA